MGFTCLCASDLSGGREGSRAEAWRSSALGAHRCDREGHSEVSVCICRQGRATPGQTQLHFESLTLQSTQCVHLGHLIMESTLGYFKKNKNKCKPDMERKRSTQTALV